MKVFASMFYLILSVVTGCSLAYEGEGETEYGTIRVSENRSDPNARELKIAYALIPSKNKGNRPPIVFLQGGPGAGSLLMEPFFSSSPLRENHDVILFDARGTGRSGAYCVDVGAAFVDLMAQNLTVEEEYDATLRLCETCKEELQANKVDVTGYNSMENAADLEVLRQHLNIEKWILFGGSYGTRLGLTYLREYPQNAEAAVFMGLFPLEVNMYEGFLSGLDQSLNHLFQLCESDPDCNRKYPALKEQFSALIEELSNEPQVYQYGGEDFVINAQDALLLVHQMLYSRQEIEAVPAFIQALEGGKDRVILQSINRRAQTLSFINAATYWSVQAKEEVQFNVDNSMEKDLLNFPYLTPGPAFFLSDQNVLEQWHSDRSGSIENQRVVTNKPILIANGGFDPITPLSNARSALSYLPNAWLVEFPYEGHTVFNDCFFDLVEAFTSGNYQVIDSSCAEKGTLHWR